MEPWTQRQAKGITLTPDPTSIQWDPMEGMSILASFRATKTQNGVAQRVEYAILETL
jgi:hypothetical protein